MCVRVCHVCYVCHVARHRPIFGASSRSSQSGNNNHNTTPQRHLPLLGTTTTPTSSPSSSSSLAAAAVASSSSSSSTLREITEEKGTDNNEGTSPSKDAQNDVNDDADDECDALRADFTLSDVDLEGVSGQWNHPYAAQPKGNIPYLLLRLASVLQQPRHVTYTHSPNVECIHPFIHSFTVSNHSSMDNTIQ